MTDHKEIDVDVTPDAVEVQLLDPEQEHDISKFKAEFSTMFGDLEGVPNDENTNKKITDVASQLCQQVWNYIETTNPDKRIMLQHFDSDPGSTKRATRPDAGSVERLRKQLKFLASTFDLMDHGVYLLYKEDRLKLRPVMLDMHCIFDRLRDNGRTAAQDRIVLDATEKENQRFMFTTWLKALVLVSWVPVKTWADVESLNKKFVTGGAIALAQVGAMAESLSILRLHPFRCATPDSILALVIERWKVDESLTKHKKFPRGRMEDAYFNAMCLHYIIEELAHIYNNPLKEGDKENAAYDINWLCTHYNIRNLAVTMYCHNPKS
jgi:hypothetical protein